MRLLKTSVKAGATFLFTRKNRKMMFNFVAVSVPFTGPHIGDVRIVPNKGLLLFVPNQCVWVMHVKQKRSPGL
ncbi:hypothetical protein D3C76_1412350 [compost metagenome]